MHGRILNAGLQKNQSTAVAQVTEKLIFLAREAQLDQQNGMRLPDLALLAHLQHFGAATPLLDVTTDPLIALWMVAFANREDPEELDEVPGYLYGIRKPQPDKWITPLDSRSFSRLHDSTSNSSLSKPTIFDAMDKNSIWWYEAPYVNDRLRIQRGSFILGPLVDGTVSSLPFRFGRDDNNWVQKRLEKMGEQSNTARSSSNVFALHVRGSLKKHLRKLLIERSGLPIDVVFPSHWDMPMLEKFSVGYGRRRKLELDYSLPELEVTP